MDQLCHRRHHRHAGRTREPEDALQPADAVGLQLRARYHGYAADTRLRHDDLHLDCSREGTRHNGGAARLTRASADGHCRQSHSLSGARFRHPDCDTADGPLCPQRAARRLAGLDSAGFGHLHSAGPFAWSAHLECGADATRGPASFGHGASDARGDALGHALPRRIDAEDPAMDFSHCPTALLHFGDA